MRTSTILWCALGIIAALVAMVTSAPQDDASCQFGRQLSNSLNQMQGFQGMMAVKCNSTCSSVFCTGRLAIDVVNVKLSYCFGLSLNHCASPANLAYFMHVPSRNITWSGIIQHNDTKALPGPSTPIGQSSIIVSTEMVHMNSSLRFGVNASVKLTEGRLELFPYKMTVIPVQTISVPPCQAGVTQAPPTWPDKCSAPPPPQATTPAPAIVSKSATYHKPCELGLLQCGLHEMCVLSGKLRKAGLCQCQSDAKLSPDTGLCEVADSQGTSRPPSVVTKSDKHANSQTTSGPKTAATNEGAGSCWQSKSIDTCMETTDAKICYCNTDLCNDGSNLNFGGEVLKCNVGLEGVSVTEQNCAGSCVTTETTTNGEKCRSL